jgi:hypothetical protein
LSPCICETQDKACPFSLDSGTNSLCSALEVHGEDALADLLELVENYSNSFWKVSKQLELENKLRSLNVNIGCQLEIIGEGIQGNKYKLKGQTAYCFNLFNIDKYEYFSYKDFIEITKKLDIPIVPIICDNFELVDDIPTLVKLASRKSLLNPSVEAEGIVIRPLEVVKVGRSEFDFAGNRLSFKSINPIFLLKEKD